MFNGQLHDATLVPVRGAQEHWNEYILEDGSVLRMKMVVTEVYRLEGMFDVEGNPIYHIKSTNVASAIPSDSVRRKAD